MDSNNVLVPGFDDEQNDVLKFKLQKIDILPNGCICSLTGYIDTYNSSFFQNQINKIIACGFVNIIMDCSKITGVASTGFGVLTNLLKIVHQNNGNIILVNVQQNIYETIELLGFTQFFKIIPTLEEAYSYITQNAGVAGNGEVFPKLVTCPSCAKSLKAQKAGRFRCINCKAIINISETGSVFVE